MEHHIVSFSGGQSSGYMLRKLIDSNRDFDKKFIVVFCNTGKEHDKTLDFVHEVEVRWGAKIVWLEYTRVSAMDIDDRMLPTKRKACNLMIQKMNGESAHWFNVVDYDSAARAHDKVTPFDKMLEWSNTIPNVRSRQCSVQLKLRTQFRYLNSIGITKHFSYIGIRKDEDHRVNEILANLDKDEIPRFPLVDLLSTKEDVDGFWDNNDFKLEIPNHMGNCNLCFLKARWKRVAAAKADPEAARWWSDWEKKFTAKGAGSGAFWNNGKTYEGIIKDAEQKDLFDLDRSEEDVACSCSVGGHRSNMKEE